MDKSKYFLVVDPIQSLDRGSHNRDVERFIHNFLDKNLIKFESGFTLKESRMKYKITYRIETVFKLIAAAVVNALKARKLSQKYDLTVFNPNDDPISLLVLQQIRHISRSNFTIKSRFICTRDKIFINQNSYIVNELKKRISNSIMHNDKLSAETESYSEYLSVELKNTVDFVPYPPIDTKFSQVLNLGEGDLYVALGAARKDKGFETLSIWIDLIMQNNPDASFVIQEAEKKWNGYEETLQKLSKLDNVRILPSFIDSASQYEVLSSAFAVLAPYDPAMYQFRGSAFTRRAMYLGKLVCTSSDTSLSKDAESHDLLIFPDSLIIEQKSLQSRKFRQDLGINLQMESIRAWAGFLL
jgi:hypothetical protein